MLGTDGVTGAIVARLQATIPAKIDELRTRLDRDKRALPAPTTILDYEPGQMEIGRWPFWYVQTVDQTAVPRIDELGAAETIYGYRYTVRVTVWLRGPEHTAEPAMRTHLLAAQEVLLAYPVLLDPDAEPPVPPGQHARLDPDSIRARTAAPEPVRGKDSICAGYLEARISTVETLAIPPRPDSTMRLETGLL